ncbi:hypothetical protein [Egicoccus sp. AB-alg2]|uniref:hypothetical protein n=1 Tax=Egicoccus sp. AB-alg2 TaxID=3242693 RepID=UPI00359E82B8
MLDFVGQHRREYGYDLRLRALIGLPRRQLAQAAEEVFPYLPSGCHLELDHQARAWVVNNLKQAVLANKTALVRELQGLAAREPARRAPPLDIFLKETGVELEDVVKAGGWALLRRAANLDDRPVGRGVDVLRKGV